MAPHKPPYRYPISDKLKADLEDCLKKIEPRRRRTYNGLLGTFVSVILFGPLVFLFLLIAAKHGWLWWINSIKPYFAWLSWLGPPKHYSRGYSKAVGALSILAITSIIEWSRKHVHKHLNKAVLPFVCDELKLSATHGLLKRKAMLTMFKRPIAALDNPLSMEGTIGDIPFLAHVITMQSQKPQTWVDHFSSNMPQFENVFQGIFITIQHQIKGHPEILVTHEESPISQGKLKQVFFEDPEYEKLFNIWSNAPHKARTFITKEFLDDIKIWDKRPEDLPKLDFHITQKHVKVFIPTDTKKWQLPRRLSQPLDSVEPIITMLTEWSILKMQLETLLKWHPNLFGERKTTHPISK